MSSFKKANKQGGKAWGQIQGQAHGAGDMLQGMRMGGGSFGGFGSSIGKGYGDFMNEMQRAYENPEKTAKVVGGVALAPVTGGASLLPAYRDAGGGTGIWHSWNNQLNPAYAKNYREDKADARREAEQAALAQRQSMMHGGIGGGGAGANAEIDRYNQILAQFAAQQQQLRSMGLQGDISSIAMIMELIGKYYTGGAGGAG